MTRTARLFWTYMADESATTAVEYALIASIISIAAIMVLTQIGINLQAIFTDTSKF